MPPRLPGEWTRTAAIPEKVRSGFPLAIASKPQAAAIAVLMLCAGAGADAVAQSTRPVRDVTPPGVTRAFRSADSPDLPRSDAVFIGPARVRADGALMGGGRTVRLAGVTLPPANRICRTASGARWTCGKHALAALRGIVARGALSCVFAQQQQQGQPQQNEPQIATCWINREDVALALLKDGWAEPAPQAAEDSYRRAAAAAREGRRGVWAATPP